MKKFVLFSILAALYVVSADVNTPYLCLPAPSQKCFTVINNQQLNWMQAEEYCEKNLPNGRLASIHNAFANSLIYGWLSFLTTDPWIGAIKLGGFPYQWVDNTPLGYTNWAPGQPTENCAQVCRMTGTSGGIPCQQGKWRTADCAKTVSQFICEYGNYTDSPTTTQAPPTAVDCLDLHQKSPSLNSGIYVLSPPGIAPFQAYCDMETNGGGWTVFQRRVDGSLSFYNKTWNEYKNGFNNGLDKNMWLGNEKIHTLSMKDSYVDLRIDIWGDRAPNSPYWNSYWWEEQSAFYIDSEANNYTLHVNTREVVGNASANPGGPNGVNYNNGRPFSTIDNYHDGRNGSCTRSFNSFGGWWSGGDICSWSSLNGQYIPPFWSFHSGYVWYNGRTDHFFINPAQSRMMLRKAT